MKLQDYTTEELKAELKARGYYTDNLWMEGDVDNLIDSYNEENGTNIELTNEDKQYILDSVINGDGVKSDVNEQLSYFFDDYIEENGLNEPDIADDTQDARNLNKY
jgi:hypothetical protein